MNYVKLNNGIEMPQLGYGLFLVAPEEAARCTADALKVGYRLLDTAQFYGNEAGVGEGIKQSGVDRKDIFLVSKIWPSDYGYEKAMARIDESLRLLQTDYLDLMLLHQPYGDIYGAYRALEDAYKAGKIRATGLSNFYADRFLDLASNFEVKPAVNQVETHVFNQETEIRQVADEFGTKVMAWAPLAQGKLDIFDNAVLKAVGERHGKTVSQVALRYLMQAGLVVIPKSTHVERMQENINIFDFELTADDMAQIKALDRNERLNNHRDLKLVRWFMTTMK
ncbi:MAG: aldo/keto reductase [Prevotella sp.]|nr:aldo/keto reductase [Prevotella sp.]